MTSERLFNSFIHPQKLLYPAKQISGYAPGFFVKIWHFGPLEVLWASATSTRTTPTTPSVGHPGVSIHRAHSIMWIRFPIYPKSVSDSSVFCTRFAKLKLVSRNHRNLLEWWFRNRNCAFAKGLQSLQIICPVLCDSFHLIFYRATLCVARSLGS